MSMFHDYMVLCSREKCNREKADNAIYSSFHGSYEWRRYHFRSKYRDSDDVYCPVGGEDRMTCFSSTARDYYDTI